MVGVIIGTISYIGFRNTGSPTLFRLTLAFFSIGIGFFIMWDMARIFNYVKFHFW